MQEDLPPDMQSLGLSTRALFCHDEAGSICASRVAPGQGSQSRPCHREPYPLHAREFYATTKQPAKAETTLRQALALNPDLVEFSKQDPDMMALLGE
jgi:hypothetical protein